MGPDPGAGLLQAQLPLAPSSTRSWRTSSPAWSRPGLTSAASPGTWSSTTSLPRWPRQTPCIPSSPGASWNTPSAGASLPMRPGSVIPRTSPKWKGASPTPGSVSSREASSRTLADVRMQAQRWCSQVAGLRIHGTTLRQPLVVFQDEERQALLPWDGQLYEIADWRNAKVHQDHHIQCLQALVLGAFLPVSPGPEGRGQGGQQAGAHLPPRPIDQDPRPPAPGRPRHRHPGLPRRTFRLHHQGARRHQGQGHRTGSPPWLSSPSASSTAPCPGPRSGRGHKLLRLEERYTPHRLDSACRRALEVDLIDVRRLERILVQALEEENHGPGTRIPARRSLRQARLRLFPNQPLPPYGLRRPT